MTILAARHIKIHPVNWNSEICMRVRIYKLVSIGMKGSNSYFILFSFARFLAGILEQL